MSYEYSLKLLRKPSLSPHSQSVGLDTIPANVPAHVSACAFNLRKLWCHRCRKRLDQKASFQKKTARRGSWWLTKHDSMEFVSILSHDGTHRVDCTDVKKTQKKQFRWQKQNKLTSPSKKKAHFRSSRVMSSGASSSSSLFMKLCKQTQNCLQMSWRNRTSSRGNSAWTRVWLCSKITCTRLIVYRIEYANDCEAQ